MDGSGGWRVFAVLDPGTQEAAGVGEPFGLAGIDHPTFDAPELRFGLASEELFRELRGEVLMQGFFQGEGSQATKALSQFPLQPVALLHLQPFLFRPLISPLTQGMLDGVVHLTPIQETDLRIVPAGAAYVPFDDLDEGSDRKQLLLTPSTGSLGIPTLGRDLRAGLCRVAVNVNPDEDLIIGEGQVFQFIGMDNTIKGQHGGHFLRQVRACIGLRGFRLATTLVPS